MLDWTLMLGKMGIGDDGYSYIDKSSCCSCFSMLKLQIITMMW